jgi:uncharacterized protein
MRNLSVIAKATRLCNLRCAYCHDWRVGTNQTMDSAVVQRVIESALSDESCNTVEFIWHGGEPTVLPISFYESAVALQSTLKNRGQVVTNRIQTNGTRLTPAWIRFLRDKRFTVSVSLDGPPVVHNSSRKYTSGLSSFNDVVMGITALKEGGIPFYTLMVIDEHALEVGPERIYNFFAEMGIKKYGLLAATPIIQPNASPGTSTDHYVNPKRMTNFLIKLYDYWKAQRDETVRIRELDAILQCVNGKSNFCTMEGNCFGRFYVVEPNGEVAHCELFQGDPSYTVGNILNDNFSDFHNNRKMAALIQENNLQLEKMKTCPHFGICNGWCPNERYLSLRHDPDYNQTCCGLKDLITHILNHMN